MSQYSLPSYTLFLQFTHVYSIKKILHIDDNDPGGVYTKVWLSSDFYCFYSFEALCMIEVP